MLEELDSCFASDPHINEIDHLSPQLVESFAGRKTPLHLVAHKLAISHGAFAQIHAEAFPLVKEYRTKVLPGTNYCVRLADKNLIELAPLVQKQGGNKFTIGEPKSVGVMMTREWINRVNSAARALLLVNGENYTALNVRRELLLLNQLVWLDNKESTRKELEFISLVCLKFRKASAAWEYRKAVLGEMILSVGAGESKKELIVVKPAEIFEENLVGTLTDADSVALSEILFLNKVDRREPRNYYAHMYRIYLFDKLTSKSSVLVRYEYENAKALCCANISDSGMFHYLFTKVAPMMKTQPGFLAEIKEWAGKLAGVSGLGFVAAYLKEL